VNDQFPAGFPAWVTQNVLRRNSGSAQRSDKTDKDLLRRAVINDGRGSWVISLTHRRAVDFRAYLLGKNSQTTFVVFVFWKFFVFTQTQKNQRTVLKKTHIPHESIAVSSIYRPLLR
jgi:hypothetical protein